MTQIIREVTVAGPPEYVFAVLSNVNVSRSSRT
jgi:hypothetical protein